MPDKEIMLQIRAREEQRAWNALDALVKGQTLSGNEADGLRDAIANLAEDFRATAELYGRAKLKGAQSSHITPLTHAAQQLDQVIKQLEQPRRAPLGQLQPPVESIRKYAGSDLDTLIETPHAFKPGDDQRTCDVVTDGLGCGRFSSHPVHRLTGPLPAGSPQGLDALIADSVAASQSLPVPIPQFSDGGVPTWTSTPDDAVMAGGGRIVTIDNYTPQQPEGEALGVTEQQRDDPAKLAGDLHDRLNGDVAAATEQHIAEMRSEDVVAYLRGDTNELTGGHPLQPRAEDVAMVSRLFDVPAEMLGTPASRVVVGELPEPAMVIDASVGPDFTGGEFTEAIIAARTAREILESHGVTMPLIGQSIPPTPLLSQPGDAGAGYDHSYIPAGGVPLTFNNLLTPVAYVDLPAHISHSQIDGIAECATKYRAGRVHGVPEIPQWALIGGTAFHAIVEHIEQSFTMDGQPMQGDPESWWNRYFDAEIQRTEESSPVPRTRWRASKQGKEHEAWWRAEGPKMVAGYLKARPAERSADLQGKPAIEIELTAAVPTPYGAIPYKAIIDRVTARDAGQLVTVLVIRDYKTGDRMPDSRDQLGEYAQLLRLLGVPSQVKIVGTYFNARKGTWTPEVDLEQDGYSAAWFAYRVAAAHGQKLALTTAPTPARPSSFCGGCPVRWACPVKTPRPTS